MVSWPGIRSVGPCSAGRPRPNPGGRLCTYDRAAGSNGHPHYLDGADGGDGTDEAVTGATKSATTHPSVRSDGSRTCRQVIPSADRSGPISSSSVPSNSPFNRAPVAPGWARRLTPSVPAPTTRTCSGCLGTSVSPGASEG